MNGARARLVPRHMCKLVKKRPKNCKTRPKYEVSHIQRATSIAERGEANAVIPSLG